MTAEKFYIDWFEANSLINGKKPTLEQCRKEAKSKEGRSVQEMLNQFALIKCQEMIQNISEDNTNIETSLINEDNFSLLNELIPPDLLTK